MRVVTGLAHRNSPSGPEFLMGLRRAGKLRPSMYEFPGGKVDPGETDAAALAREWLEEFGAEVAVKIEAAVAELEARARRGEMAPRDLQEVRAQLADARKLESTVTALGALLRRVRNDVIRDDQWQGTDLLAAVDEALGALDA